MELSVDDLRDRAAETQEAFRWLIPNPALPTGTPTYVSRRFYHLASEMTAALGDGPQLVLMLQDLTRAKDAGVRQALADGQK